MGAEVGRSQSPNGLGASKLFSLDLFVSPFILGSVAFALGWSGCVACSLTEVALRRVLISAQCRYSEQNWLGQWCLCFTNLVLWDKLRWHTLDSNGYDFCRDAASREAGEGSVSLSLEANIVGREILVGLGGRDLCKCD